MGPNKKVKFKNKVLKGSMLNQSNLTFVCDLQPPPSKTTKGFWVILLPQQGLWPVYSSSYVRRRYSKTWWKENPPSQAIWQHILVGDFFLEVLNSVVNKKTFILIVISWPLLKRPKSNWFSRVCVDLLAGKNKTHLGSSNLAWLFREASHWNFNNSYSPQSTRGLSHLLCECNILT